MNICLTGGTGFIGSMLCTRLQHSGAGVRIVSRRALPERSGMRLFQADLTDPASSLHGLFDDVDVMLHCAGEIREPALMQALHVTGLQRLLAEAQAHFLRTGRPLHWVQLSSVGAYGPASESADTPRQITESSPTAAVGIYEVSKTRADQLLIDFAASQPLLSITILRPSIVISRDMPNQSVRSLVRFIKKGWFFYIGTAATVATYIHVDDVVEALVLCATEVGARGEIFNISNDCLLSEIVVAVAREQGRRPPTLHLPAWPLRLAVRLLGSLIPMPLSLERIDALVRRTRYPNQKILQKLGFSPRHAIPAAVVSLFDD